MNLLRLRVVLASIELDEAALTILQTAEALAEAAGARLHLMHVLGGAGGNANHEGDVSVRAFLHRVGFDDQNTSLHVLRGDPAASIRALGDKIRADVIVIGPHRERVDGFRALGSTALGVVTTSWAPCLVIGSPMRLPVRRVLVPLDLSDTARGALVVALSWASALRSKEGHDAEVVRLTPLFADQHSTSTDVAPRVPRQLEDDLARIRAEGGSWAAVVIEGPVVVLGDPVPVIASYATKHGVDLIVLGTRGLGLDAVGRLGSVSAGVANLVDTPILLVPPAVWQTYAPTS